MVATSSQRFRTGRKIPTVLLFAQHQQQQRRRLATTKSGTNNNKSLSFKWILLFGLIIIGIQIALLRSVSIHDQVPHDYHEGSTVKSMMMKDVKSDFRMLYDEPMTLSEFPKWIQEYVTWHQQVRQQFPGMELFQNPKAPHLLIRTCLGLCGGLHDRIGQLPWDLYLAYKTKRVLLLAWQRPQSLENFLIPSGLLNWTVPHEANFGFHDMHRVRNMTQLFHVRSLVV